MARFDLDSYETVDSRIKRFMADWPNARLLTEIVDMSGEPGKTRWIVKASIWRERIDGEPDATGYAFEVDGTGMANQTSALENAESSARGRCLQALGYTGAKSPSREEMEKVARARDWLGEADNLALSYNVDGLRLLYADAVAAKVDKETLAKIKDYGTNAAKP